MRPFDALQRAIEHGWWRGNMCLGQGRPGEVIQRLAEETRAALRSLRSEDVASVRISDGRGTEEP